MIEAETSSSKTGAKTRAPLGMVNRYYYLPTMPRFDFDSKWLLGVNGHASDYKKLVFTLYDLNTGKVVNAFEGHTEEIHDIRMSVDRKFAVTAAGAYKVNYQSVDKFFSSQVDQEKPVAIMAFGLL
jgi:hypothetical protein